MNWNYLMYAILCLLFSLAIYVYHGRWVKSRKLREGISNYDRGAFIPQDWGPEVLTSTVLLYNGVTMIMGFFSS